MANQFLTPCDAGFDPEKVKIIGWEYSIRGDDINFSPRDITHSVAWMRPRFERLDTYSKSEERPTGWAACKGE